MQLSYYVREYTEDADIFARQLTLYPRHIMRDVTLPSVKSTKVNIQYMERAKCEGEGEKRDRGKSFWLRRSGRIHGRASFSKVSARTRMLLVDSRMGTGRINDRDRDRLPKELLCRSCFTFFSLPAEDNGNREESTSVRLR